MNASALHLPTLPAPAARDAAPRLRCDWARDASEVREAQRLRFRVFALELGARLSPPAGTPYGLDADEFDPHCEHLLVREQTEDGAPGPVVACYRLLGASAALRVGGFYAETAFDLTRLRSHRNRIGELGRACVAPEHRRGAAMLMMWGAIAQRMQQLGLDLLLGSASVPALDGGSAAWALWNRLAETQMAGIEWRVRPRLPLHPALAPRSALVEPPAAPPLLRAYLNANARILGAPAWDADFRCADFPLLLPLQDLPASYRRRFLEAR
ncbi:GNAT family N-acetyltransferase [Inhella sp.]|uniref:GNAT family N-acetyltransferase n=1 Tax=Inhella sp. TaxID=1921806 RepID=UPI0035AF1D60